MAHGEKPLIGILMSIAESDREASSRREAILQGLGRTNLRFTIRFGRKNYDSNLNDYDTLARNLVALKPAVLFSSCFPTMIALARATANAQPDEDRRIPIVYAGLFNKDGQASHYDFAPNVTGFVSHEFDVCKKWPDYLRKVAPRMTKAAVIHENTSGGTNQLQAIKQAAPQGFVEPIELTTFALLEQAVQNFKANTGGAGGLIVTTGALTATLAEQIIQLANREGLPAIYPNRLYSIQGGLLSYGADLLDLYKAAGRCLGKLLDGARPSDFPPHINKHFELVINLGTAKSLNLLPISNDLRDQARLLIGE
jgi:ABC-type uncharacterized transport system substrate-binding protein